MGVRVNNLGKNVNNTSMGTPPKVASPPKGRVYFVARTSAPFYHQYGLKFAYDLKSVELQKLFTDFFASGTASGIWVKPDGTRLWTTDDANNTIKEFSFSTRYDIASINEVQQISAGTTEPTEIFWKGDGTQFWTTRNDNQSIQEYNLTTVFDISTASIGSVLSTTFTELNGLFISPDGVYLFVCGTNPDEIRRFTLSTSWNITTATQDQIVDNLIIRGSNFRDVTFKPDGTRMYYINDGGNEIVQYVLGTPWDLTTLLGQYNRHAPNSNTAGISIL